MLTKKIPEWMTCMIQSLQRWELAILYSVQNNLRSPILDFVMVVITRLSEAGALWLIFSIILMLTKKYKQAGFTLLSSQIIVIIANEVILKNIFRRPRPPDLNPYIYLLVSRPQGFGFPSGHATLSFVAATVIFFYNKKFGAAAFILAAIIAFSRVYLYVHFPSDVIVGAVSGVLLACLTIAITKRIFAENERIKNNESHEQISGLSEDELAVVIDGIRLRSRKLKKSSGIMAVCTALLSAVFVITDATGFFGLVIWFAILIMGIVAVALFIIGMGAVKKESRLTEAGQANEAEKFETTD